MKNYHGNVYSCPQCKEKTFRAYGEREYGDYHCSSCGYGKSWCEECGFMYDHDDKIKVKKRKGRVLCDKCAKRPLKRVGKNALIPLYPR